MSKTQIHEEEGAPVSAGKTSMGRIPRQDRSAGKSRRSGILRSALLSMLLLVLAILAVRGQTPYPMGTPQNRCWTDSIVDFLASYKEIIVFVMAIVFGLYRFLSIPKGMPSRIWTAVWAVLVPALSFVIVEAYNKGYWHVGARVSYENAPPLSRMLLLNLLLYYLFFFGLTFLLGSFFAGYAAASAFLMAVAIVNFYIQQFRGNPIVPWDFFSIRTAANVAGNFEYKIWWQMLLATFGFVFLLLTIGKMKGKIRPLPVRIGGFLITAAALVFVVGGLQKDDMKSFWGIDTTLFTPNVRYTKNGFWPAFLSNLSFLHIDKPDGYSTEAVKRIAEDAGEAYEERSAAAQDQPDHKTETELSPDYETEEKASEAVTDMNPNIIVIMNEAFSDLAVLGDFNTNEDYMPYFRSLMQDYTSGHLLVSVKGGNTANTEYEFLSGDTMAYLPPGCVVFQQYVNQKVPTIASYLGELGYETIGMHPYLGSGWERDRVYPLMGFDTFLDQDAFSGADRLRNYVSDKGAFDKVIELFENKEKGKSQFQFLVTMQNHSGYSPKDTDNGFKEEVFLTDVPVQTPAVVATERYLTLIRYSDEAFAQLIDYFEKHVTEPTLIVMFGDHEPNDYVTQVIDDLVGNKSFETASDNSGAADGDGASPEEVEKYYQVPFVIWNNYGLEKDASIDLTSVNYLGAILLEEAGLPLSDFYRFERNMQKQIPALAAGAWVNQEGVYQSWAVRDTVEAYEALLNDYNILEYNHLIDKRNRVEEVFSASGNAG